MFAYDRTMLKKKGNLVKNIQKIWLLSTATGTEQYKGQNLPEIFLLNLCQGKKIEPCLAHMIKKKKTNKDNCCSKHAHDEKCL